jgi:hypothetical protein
MLLQVKMLRIHHAHDERFERGALAHVPQAVALEWAKLGIAELVDATSDSVPAAKTESTQGAAVKRAVSRARKV